MENNSALYAALLQGFNAAPFNILLGLRAGNKVMVTRMELRNEEQTLIAAATATYLY